MKYYTLFTVLFLALTLASSFAVAKDPAKIGTYGAWEVYEFMENGNKVCYMVSQPTAARGSYSRRGDIFALVTHRPAEGTKNVFSYITGYTYKSGENVSLSVDGTRFSLFTQDDTAWTPDAETDSRLANALQQGNKMIVRGVSSRGTKTTDTFSLKGSTAAYKKMSSACGY